MQGQRFIQGLSLVVVVLGWAVVGGAQQKELKLTLEEAITGVVEKPQLTLTFVRKAPKFEVITGEQRRSFLDLLLEPIPQDQVGKGNNSRTVQKLLKPQKQKLKPKR